MSFRLNQDLEKMRASNGRLYVRFVLDGVEYTKPTGLADTKPNRAKAVQMEAQAKALARQGKWEQYQIKSRPFRAAAESFLEWAKGEYAKEESFLRIRGSFASLIDFFGESQMSAITPGRIDNYKTYRRQMGVKEVTLRHDLHSLSLFFQYAMRQGWARENVVRKVKIPSDAGAVRMTILTEGQESLFLETCLWMDRAAKFIPSPDQKGYRDLHDFARLMLELGTRPEELLELKKENVDILQVGYLYVVDGKSKAAKRRLKLNETARAILTSRMSQPGPYIFPSPKNCGRHRGKHWRTLDQVLEALTGKEHAVSCVAYDFRHTFATRAAADGMPIPTLAAILGHGDLKSVAKYIHISSAHMDLEIERLEKVRRERKTLATSLPTTMAKTGKNEHSTTKQEGVIN